MSKIVYLNTGPSNPTVIDGVGNMVRLPLPHPGASGAPVDWMRVICWTVFVPAVIGWGFFGVVGLITVITN